jgi:hypothetical protein
MDDNTLLKSDQMSFVANKLEKIRDDFRNWCAGLSVHVIARDKNMQKLITDYDNHLTKAIEALSTKGL